MAFSYSRINCFANCPRQYKYRYLDKFKTLPNQDANNALYLGNAIHKAFETGELEDAITEYKRNYYVLSDEHINEEIKLRELIPKVLELLPPAECEVEIKTEDFIGYIDRLVYLYTDSQGISHYEIWDYKYCNVKSKEKYLKSPQLSIYKYYFEQTHPNCVVDKLKYVFVPKIAIRQKFKAKPPETLTEFRNRLMEHLAASEIEIAEVEFSSVSITDFEQCCQLLTTVENFPKNETRLCDWCEYKEYCQSDGGVDYMIV